MESAHGHRSTRADTAKTGATRRASSRGLISQGGQRSGSELVEFGARRASDYLITERNRSNKARVSSAHKTMLWRDDRKDRSKISEIAK